MHICEVAFLRLSPGKQCLVTEVNNVADVCTVSLQLCCEELKLKTDELSQQQETVADLQSQLECLRFVC